jgi:VIT1/CCC1 family predicted Fe2+/Mn2+ transporter
MVQKKLVQKKQSSLSVILHDLFIKSMDGVVIVFFVSTGLISAGVSNKIIVTIGIGVSILAALIMGISAHLTGKEEKNHFSMLGDKGILDAEDLKEKKLLENLGLGKHIQSLAQQEIEKDRELWQNLWTKLNDEQSVDRNYFAFKGAGISFLSTIIGGMIPVIPYLFETDSRTALQVSSIFSLLTLFIFGYFKSVSLRTPLIGGAIGSLLKGALAGIGGYFIAKLFVQII